MRNIVVIRFSSLGDLCVLGGSLARFADRTGSPGHRVTLVTKQAFAPLMKEFRGVDRVIALPGSDRRSLFELAGTLRSESWDFVVDAHNTLRSGLLLGLMGRRPDTRLAKDTVDRLAYMKWGRRSVSLERSMSDRFDDLFVDIPSTTSADGEPRITTPDIQGIRPASGNSADGPVLGIAPGAQWAPKQWPEEKFAELLSAFRRHCDARVIIFLGPREEEWFAGSRLAAVADELGGIRIHRNLSLTEIIEPLASCSLLLTNDSGLLHLAEASGTPVLAFFGPTVREFGYFPRLEASNVLEYDLECRPCSRNGKRSCHRNDLACLANIAPTMALEKLLASAPWNGCAIRKEET